MIYAETVLPVTYPFDLFCIVDKCNLRHAKRNVNVRRLGAVHQHMQSVWMNGRGSPMRS